MTLTVRELMGEALTRFEKPQRVQPAQVLFALNNAQEDLLAAMHEADIETLHAEVALDVVAGTAEYTLPAVVSRIVKVERNDIDNSRAWPSVELDKRKDDLQVLGSQYPSSDEPYTHTFLPGNKIRFNQTPAQTLVAGVKLYYEPFVVRLATLDEVPTGIPAQIQEALVPRAVVRLASMGHQIANPKAFEAYAQVVEQQLNRHLYPAHGERYRDVEDVQGIYAEDY